MKSIKTRLRKLELRRAAFSPDFTEDMNFLSALFSELNDDILKEIAYGEDPEGALLKALNMTATDKQQPQNEK